MERGLLVMFNNLIMLICSLAYASGVPADFHVVAVNFDGFNSVPVNRSGRSGVAAAKRAAVKRRNRARHKRG